MKSAGTTDAKDRRIVIIDLLIGVGIPVLQMVLRECVWPFAFGWLFTRMK